MTPTNPAESREDAITRLRELADRYVITADADAIRTVLALLDSEGERGGSAPRCVKCKQPFPNADPRRPILCESCDPFMNPHPAEAELARLREEVARRFDRIVALAGGRDPYPDDLPVLGDAETLPAIVAVARAALPTEGGDPHA